MFLGIFHPSRSEPLCVEAPRMDDEIQLLVEYSKMTQPFRFKNEVVCCAGIMRRGRRQETCGVHFEGYAGSFHGQLGEGWEGTHSWFSCRTGHCEAREASV